MIDLDLITSFNFGIDPGTADGQYLSWNVALNKWEAVPGGGGANFENTITVAKSGGNYTTIQAAIDVATSADLIRVYPGVYTEALTAKAGITTTIEGVGVMGTITIQQDSATVLTIPATSVCQLKNVKLKSTATGANSSKLVEMQGVVALFNKVYFDYDINNGYNSAVINLATGSNIFSDCKWDFTSTGTSGNDNNFIVASGTARFQLVRGYAKMSIASIVAAEDVHFIQDNSNSDDTIHYLDVRMSAPSASFAGEMCFMNSSGSGEIEVQGNKIKITTPSGVVGSYAQAYYLSGTSGLNIHSTGNRIEITGFESDYFGNIAATETLISHFDDIVANSGVTGNGTYSYVNSPSDGDLQMSGDIIQKVVTMTTDHPTTADWEFGILDAIPSTVDITATVDTSIFGTLPSGAKKMFINSGAVHNLIIDPNGAIIDGSPNDRVIYPGGYIIVEKIGSQSVIISSRNTSFNIELSDIANKSFHLDFSNASSVTQSGDDITSMIENINSWSGDGTTLAGRIKYGLTAQNSLNTGLWDSANSTLNFGDRDIHSNLSNRGLTIIAIVKPKYGGDAIISKYADNVPNAEWRFLTNSAVIYDELDRSGTEATLNFSSNYEEWQILEMAWIPTGRLFVYKNGYLMGSSSYSTDDIPSGTAALMVGISDITGMDYYGEIAEIIALSDTLTSDERSALTSKLGAKWDIDTAVFSSSDSSPFGRNSDTNTISPLIDNDNIDIGTGVFDGIIGDGTELESSGAPTTDSMIANKKYVDDTVAATNEFSELTDVTGAYTTANALYKANSTPDGLEETTTLLTEPIANQFQIARGTSELLVQGDLTIETDSAINQDVTTDASPTFTQATISNSPSASTDTVNKAYADGLESSTFWNNTTVASTADVDIATELENGDTIDGYTLVTGDRVLLKNQTDATENGLYVVVASGAASRSTDADIASEIENRKCIPENGTAGANKMFFCTSSSITLGTTDIDFVEVTTSGVTTTGENYLSQAGSVITANAVNLASSNVTGMLPDGNISSAATWNAKQNALTFGIANTNAVDIDSTTVADNDYAKFTVNGLEGRSYAEIKTDLSLNLVENTALSTWEGTANLITLGTITTGIWDSTDIAVASGGTGRGTATANSVLCGGITSTGAHQSVASVGTLGQVLTSNGVGALPTFQTGGGSNVVDGSILGQSVFWDVTGSHYLPQNSIIRGADGTLTYNHIVTGSDIVPTMTSNTAPSGTVADSSANATAYLAFDGNITTYTIDAAGTPYEIGYTPATSQEVAQYKIRGRTGYTDRTARTWTLRGYNGSWVVLDTRTNITWAAGEEKTFDVTQNQGVYSEYKIVVTAYNPQSGYENYIHFSEIQFLGVSVTTFAGKMEGATGFFGFGTSTPSARIESLDDSNAQYRAAFSDSIYTDFITDGSGDLTVQSTGEDYTFQGSTNPNLILSQASPANYGGTFRFRKARGTLGTPTIVSNGDTVGNFTFQGYDGSNYQNLAQIRAVVSTAPGVGDMPGKLEFYTTPDGSTSSTLVMVMRENQRIAIGGHSNPQAKVDIESSTETQLRLGHTNVTDYCDFIVDDNGYMNVAPSGGNMGIGLTPTTNMAGLSIEAGLLTLKETTTPTEDTNYGKIYTKSDNHLYFQSGDGVEHEVITDGSPSGVFAYLSIGTNTTCTLADTWYPVSGTFTNPVLEDFAAATVITPGIKYTGAKTQYFEIDIHATISADDNGIITKIGIKKNGVIENGSIMATFLRTLDRFQCVSGTCVLELSQNDEIQLVIQTNNNGDILTVEHFTTTITKFFD